MKFILTVSVLYINSYKIIQLFKIYYIFLTEINTRDTKISKTDDWQLYLKKFINFAANFSNSLWFDFL